MRYKKYNSETGPVFAKRSIRNLTLTIQCQATLASSEKYPCIFKALRESQAYLRSEDLNTENSSIKCRNKIHTIQNVMFCPNILFKILDSLSLGRKANRFNLRKAFVGST